MVIEVDESFIRSMHAVLQECAGADEMNGPASYMLAQGQRSKQRSRATFESARLFLLEVHPLWICVRLHRMAAQSTNGNRPRGERSQ